MIKRITLAVTALLLCACSSTRVAEGDALRARVAAPDEAVIQMYKDIGATEAKAHALTDAEWALVERAIGELPPLYRDVLQRRLVRLSFIDAPQSAGTALTRDLDGEGPGREFDITLRADVLTKSLNDFLNEKEARLFEDDGSGVSVHIDAGDAPALPYILLHEATHVVDRTLELTAREDSAFRAGLWVDQRQLAAPYDASVIARTVFRRGEKIPMAQAADVYRALCASPFVSLYATAAAGEDVAELFAWRRMSRRFGATLAIEVKNAWGEIVERCAPLRSRLVEARFREVDAVLAHARDAP